MNRKGRKKTFCSFAIEKKVNYMEVVLSYIASGLCMGFMVFIFAKGIIKAVRNARGYRQMEADRKANGQPFLGMYDEELEKEMYGIDD